MDKNLLGILMWLFFLGGLFGLVMAFVQFFNGGMFLGGGFWLLCAAIVIFIRRRTA